MKELKQKSVADLLELRSQKVQESRAIVEKGKTEGRVLTKEEEQSFRSLNNEIMEIDSVLNEKRGELLSQKPEGREVKKEDRFALVSLLQSVVRGEKLTDESRALIEEGAEINRVSGVGSATGFAIPILRGLGVSSSNGATAVGTALVENDKRNVLDPISNKLVLVQAGASYLTGLKGNIEIPAYSGTTSQWEGEMDENHEGQGTFSSVSLSPKRLSTSLIISKQLIEQDTVGVYDMLMRSIYTSISTKLESTILGAGDGASGKEPLGLFNGTIENKGAITFARLVSLEEENEATGVYSNQAYITTPKGKSILRSTLKGANTAGIYLSDGNTVNGYPLLSTRGVASNLNTGEEGLLFGDFSNLLIGQWGALDLVIDPYTKARNGALVLTVNTYFDAVVQRAGAISVASFKAGGR